MIFIVGGNNQGKLNCAKEMFGDGYIYVDHYHEVVRNQLQASGNALEQAEQLLQEKKESGEFEKLVIISDELGCGIVPIDAFEREYREVNGRVNCYLAKEANMVIRVVCGIGTIIKEANEQ